MKKGYRTDFVHHARDGAADAALRLGRGVAGRGRVIRHYRDGVRMQMQGATVPFRYLCEVSEVREMPVEVLDAKYGA